MQTTCSIHNMVLSCVSPSSYPSFVTMLKDFAPLGASLFSILIAGAAFWVARSQKKINANTYRLNLFKERFAAYKKFKERYEFIPKDEDELVSKLKKKTYPDSSYMSILEEVNLLFDKDHTIEKLMNSIQFSRESGFLNCLIIYYIQVLEDDNEGMFLNLGKDGADLSSIISDRYKSILSYLRNEELLYFPNIFEIKMDNLKICANIDGKKVFPMIEDGFIKHIRRDDVLKEYNDLYHKVKSSIQKARETYTKALTDEEHYHYDIIANERTYLDQIKEMMERKLSLPSNPTD